MNILEKAFTALGSAMMGGGSNFLKAGYGVWKAAADAAVTYAKMEPMQETTAWSIVTGGIYTLSLSFAASLCVLFFVLGWLQESIDLRSNFQLENIFRFLIRYILTIALIANALALAQGIADCTSAIVETVSTDMTTEEADEGVFAAVRAELEEEDDAVKWMEYGIICFIGGLMGGVTIIVCAFNLLVTVASRLFRVLLCIPFAPCAMASFAGGREYAHIGRSWLRSYIGYCLQAVVVVLALAVSMGLFQDARVFSGADSVFLDAVLRICSFCLPMITACACVRGADEIVRRCLGL